MPETALHLRFDNMPSPQNPVETQFTALRNRRRDFDALSEIAQIARTAIQRCNALQRQLALERARYAALQRRLDALIGQVERSHAEF